MKFKLLTSSWNIGLMPYKHKFIYYNHYFRKKLYNSIIKLEHIFFILYAEVYNFFSLKKDLI